MRGTQWWRIALTQGHTRKDRGESQPRSIDGVNIRDRNALYNAWQGGQRQRGGQLHTRRWRRNFCKAHKHFRYTSSALLHLVTQCKSVSVPACQDFVLCAIEVGIFINMPKETRAQTFTGLPGVPLWEPEDRHTVRVTICSNAVMEVRLGKIKIRGWLAFCGIYPCVALTGYV